MSANKGLKTSRFKATYFIPFFHGNICSVIFFKITSISNKCLHEAIWPIHPEISMMDSSISEFGQVYSLSKQGVRHKTQTEWQYCININQTAILNLVLLNLDMPCFCKQCRSRSVGFYRSQLIWICTVCHSVFEFEPGSSKLIGWKLEVGMAS